MSLETALFIKDLVATNPLGTDPKSQGDDHLRLIKAVLKSQFPGLTDGIGITRKESEINQMLIPGSFGLGGPLSAAEIPNVDAPGAVTRWWGIGPGTVGTRPPGFAVGDTLLNIAYDANRFAQIYFANTARNIYARLYAPGYGNWVMFSGDHTFQAYALNSDWVDAGWAGFRRVNGITYMAGVLQKFTPIASGNVIATLPLGFRPQALQQITSFVTYQNLSTQIVQIEIALNGNMTIKGAITLSGVNNSAVLGMGISCSFPAVLA